MNHVQNIFPEPKNDMKLDENPDLDQNPRNGYKQTTSSQRFTEVPQNFPLHNCGRTIEE